MQPIEIIPAQNMLGESVLWDARRQCVWWTDIQTRHLFRYDWAHRQIHRIDTPERLCSFGLVRESDRLVAAFDRGFALFDPGNADVEWLARPTRNQSGIRFNDGRVDHAGRFWSGTMRDQEPRNGEGSLYCLDGDGEVSQRVSGIGISNGICWSPDGSRLYFADSARRTIYVYDADPVSGVITNRRIFVQTPPGVSPDGAVVDSQGYLWSAQWGAGRVVRYGAEGRIDYILEVPASQPTCVAFGGRARTFCSSLRHARACPPARSRICRMPAMCSCTRLASQGLRNRCILSAGRRSEVRIILEQD